MSIDNLQLQEILLTLLDSTAHSVFYTTWRLIGEVWSAGWYIILPGIIVFVAWEVLTRNSTYHYNSRNGYSPTFNKFVGSGTYFLLQSIVYGLIIFITSEEAYRHMWPYVLHIAVFWSTGMLLNGVGFWVYQKRP